MIEYTEHHELDDLVKQVIEDEKEWPSLAPLREAGLTILSCMRTKLGKEDQLEKCMPRPAIARKITDLERVFISGHWIIVMDAWAWDSTQKERARAVYGALYDIQVKKTDKGWKISRRAPDLIEHSAVVKDCGFSDVTEQVLGLLSTQKTKAVMMESPAKQLAEQAATAG